VRLKISAWQRGEPECEMFSQKRKIAKSISAFVIRYSVFGIHHSLLINLN